MWFTAHKTAIETDKTAVVTNRDQMNISYHCHKAVSDPTVTIDNTGIFKSHSDDGVILPELTAYSISMFILITV